MNNVDEFANLDADVITSLLVVFRPLVHRPAIRGDQYSVRQQLTSTISMILFTAVMMPSRPGTGAILTAVSNTPKDAFRALYTSFRRFRVGVSEDIQAWYRAAVVVSGACW